MITERGPHGTVAVMTIKSEKEVVPHALSALRSRSLRNCLPIYLRELFGQTQLCADCTGMIPISDPKAPDIFVTETQKIHEIANWLESVVDVLDLALDPSGLSLFAEDVWIDSGSGRIFFTYLPLRNEFGTGCILSSMDSFSLEKLLMSHFFRPTIPDTIRHKLTDAVEKGEESLFLKAVSELRETRPDVKQKRPYVSPLTQVLLTIIFTMLITLVMIRGIAPNRSDTGEIRKWAVPYVLIFGGITVSALVRFRNIPDPKPEKECAVSKRKTETSLFFPKSDSMGSEGSTPFHFPLHPGFLCEENEYGKKTESKRRGVIWTDDFLIGSDRILCDFVLDHPSVSHKHARIVFRQGIFYLTDLGSDCGSFIGHRKLYTFEENPLTDNDIIRIGEIRFRFSCADPSDSKSKNINSP